jgi:glutamate synthase domain-containing protein 2
LGKAAKALAMGADAVAFGQGVLVALGCNSDTYITPQIPMGFKE